MEPEAGTAPAFEIRRPAGQAAPVVFASPHSGDLYPADMRPAPSLDPLALRRSEDRFVDRLIGRGPEYGFPLIAARYGRAYLDLNRATDEVDGDMIKDGGAGLARRRTAKVAAGLGVTPRLGADGQEIYDRPLSAQEIHARLGRIHRPYHAALAGLLAEAAAGFGAALLVDWHSMPSAAVEGDIDLVIGDRYGAACTPAVSHWLATLLTGLGFRVQHNTPYAGGYALEAHGRPEQGVNAVQIEINRGLYLDEASLEPGRGYGALAGRVEAILAAMAATSWAALLHRA